LSLGRQRIFSRHQADRHAAVSLELGAVVVRYLMQRGVKPERLVAAGFGEFQALDAASSDGALRKNRRIALKLTER
jgi:outer membrane protein OmpA-like peptidoglycan-associated protein